MGPYPQITQEPKIAMKPREVRLQKGPRGLGLINFFSVKLRRDSSRRFYQSHDASHPQNRRTLSTVMAVGLCVFAQTAKVSETFF